jgi:hypothetical protein
MPLTRPQASILGADTLSTGSAALNIGVGILENSNTINSGNYSITTGSNAMSVGPVTVSVNSNVVVPVGSVWTII